MPKIKVNGAELYYDECGSGPEAIVFSHGLLMDHTMFEPQRAAFASRYRVIAYDHPGQGCSAHPGDGYSLESLSETAAALIQSLHAAPCHFVGLSMGGFVGIRLAARHPTLIRSLVLMNTGADKEPLLSRIRYSSLALLVSMAGPAPFVSVAMRELFGASTRRDASQRALLDDWRIKLRNRPRRIARSLLAVMNRAGVNNELASIHCPTLIIAGEEDTPQPPWNSERLAAKIAGAQLVRIPHCGHSSSLEAPERVIAAIREFLSAQKPSA